jgi:hypothetical protein
LTDYLDIQSDLKLLEYVSNPRVELANLSWPEMSAFLKTWRNAERAVGDQFNDRELEVRRSLLRFIRLCNGSPMTPVAHEEGVHSLQAALRLAMETGSSNLEIWTLLQNNLDRLLTSKHPAGQFLEEWITGRKDAECPPGHVRAGQPSVTIVARDGGEASLVSGWLTDMELFASVMSYQELRHGHVNHYLTFLGPPERYVGSQWLKSPSSWFRSQWLVTSPAAQESVFIHWPGHNRWRFDLLGNWEGAAIPELEVSDYEEAQSVGEMFEDFDIYPIDTPHLPKIQGHKNDLVRATGFQVVTSDDPVWIYFSSEIPPRPRHMTSEVNKIEFLKPSQIRPGVLLVLNEHSARPEIMDHYTRKYWEKNYPDDRIEDAEGAKEALKVEVQNAIDGIGRDELARRLTSSGLDSDYAKVILTNILAPDYIAPRRRDVISLLERSGNFRLAPKTGSLLRHLRVSRQQAGVEINELLREKLLLSNVTDALHGSANDGWRAVETPDLGRIAVHAVLPTPPVQREVPKSWLGRLMGQD